MVRLKLSHIQESCLKLGFEFLDEKYRNSSFKHTFRCIKHDQTFKGCYKTLRRGIGLRCCRLDRIKQWQDFRKHTVDQVKAFCLESGFALIDQDYQHVNFKHHLKCLKHNQIHKASYKQIKRGIGLKCCHKPIKQNSEDYLIDKLESLGFKLLTKFDGVNSKAMVKCKKHGKVFFATVKSIVKDHRKLPCCISEDIKPTPAKPNVQTQEWRHETKEKNEFTCFVCRMKNLTDKSSVAHEVHLEDRDTICLCNTCNVLFHKTYGFTGNTKNQYEEFVECYKKDPGGAKAVLKKINWK